MTFLFGLIFIFIILLCQVFTLAILLRVVVFWVLPGPTNVLTRMLYQTTEPILVPLRRIIPRIGTIDFTPLVAVVIMQLIVYLLFYLLPS